jgi:hypothetical protein
MTFVLKLSGTTVVDDETNHYRRKELPGLETPAKKGAPGRRDQGCASINSSALRVNYTGSDCPYRSDKII